MLKVIDKILKILLLLLLLNCNNKSIEFANKAEVESEVDYINEGYKKLPGHSLKIAIKDTDGFLVAVDKCLLVNAEGAEINAVYAADTYEFSIKGQKGSFYININKDGYESQSNTVFIIDSYDCFYYIGSEEIVLKRLSKNENAPIIDQEDCDEKVAPKTLQLDIADADELNRIKNEVISYSTGREEIEKPKAEEIELPVADKRPCIRPEVIETRFDIHKRDYEFLIDPAQLCRTEREAVTKGDKIKGFFTHLEASPVGILSEFFCGDSEAYKKIKPLIDSRIPQEKFFSFANTVATDLREIYRSKDEDEDKGKDPKIAVKDSGKATRGRKK